MKCTISACEKPCRSGLTKWPYALPERNHKSSCRVIFALCIAFIIKLPRQVSRVARIVNTRFAVPLGVVSPQHARIVARFQGRKVASTVTFAPNCAHSHNLNSLLTNSSMDSARQKQQNSQAERHYNVQTCRPPTYARK